MALKCDVVGCGKQATHRGRWNGNSLFVCREHSSHVEIVSEIEANAHAMDDYARYVRGLPKDQESMTFAEWKRESRPTK